MADPDTLRHALELAAFGWPVFFIRYADKLPFRGTNGVKDATTDEATLRAEFKRRRGKVNLAAATGAPGPTVLDIDSPEHAAARALLGVLNGVAPPVVATVRGRHLFFAGTAAPTIALDYGELRSVGSYVVVPPSIHPEGREYVWLEPPRATLPPLPRELAGLARSGGAGRGEHEPAERIPHGQRHEKLKDFAIHLLRGGITDQGVLAEQLEAHFRARFDPEPPPRKGEFSDIAKWADEQSDIAKRERERAAEVAEAKPKKGKSKGKLDHPPAADAPLAEHREYVRAAGGWPSTIDITNVVRRGGRGSSRLKIELSNGQLILFDRQEQVAERRHWARTVVMHTNGIARPSTLTDWQAIEVLRSLCILADAPLVLREHEDIDNYMKEFEAMTEPLDNFDTEEGKDRFDATDKCHARGSWEPNRGTTDRPVMIVATDGTRYVRAGELLTYFNWRGFNISPADLESRMSAIGLKRVVWHGREAPRLDGERRRTNRMVVYELPPETETENG